MTIADKEGEVVRVTRIPKTNEQEQQKSRIETLAKGCGQMTFTLDKFTIDFALQ